VLGLLECGGEIRDLLLEQEAGGRGLEVGRHALGRRVGAVRGPERIVYIHIAERGEPLRKLGIVLLLFGVEAEVLEDDNLAGRHGRDSRLDVGSDAVVQLPHRPVEQVAEPGRGWSQTEFGLRLAFGPAEVRH